MAYNLYVIVTEANKMDRAKMRVLVSILKESPLYETISHEEKISLLFKLLKDYPSLFCQQI
jgi:hypothetical protein